MTTTTKPGWPDDDVFDWDAVDTRSRLRRQRRRYGPWTYVPRTLVLRHEPSGTRPGHNRAWYEVDLERIHDSHSALDCIAQVKKKGWDDDHTIGALVRALDDLFDLQHSFCPGGKAGPGLEADR